MNTRRRVVKWQRIFCPYRDLLLGTVPDGFPNALAYYCTWHKVLFRVTGALIAVIVVSGIVGLGIAPNTTFVIMERMGFLVVSGLIVVHGLVFLYGTRCALRRFANVLIQQNWRICMGCGYSLIGLASPNRCPECGVEYSGEGLRAQWNEWLSHNGLAKLGR